MNNKFLLLVVILSVFLCTACGFNGSSQNQSGNASDGYPIVLVDQAGREVTIEHEVKSLVSSYYITTTALLALDLKDEIKGVESDPERRNIYKLCAPELFDVTQVGSPKDFDIEACALIKPDLVLLPLRAKDMVEPLEELGITVLVVNPESQNDVMEMIELIGKATGREKKAHELTDYIQKKVDNLNKALDTVETPTVYLGGNSSFFSTAPAGMYQNDLITLAGGKNVAGNIDDTYWVEVDYEQILEWDPEYIIMASEAKYPMEEIEEDDSLVFCKAIKNHNVYKIPSDIEAWDSPVPSSYLGAAYLASVLHPELVSESQYKDMVKEYYETFYGFSYTEE